MIASMLPIRQYVRSPHLQGSRLQPGDEDVAQLRLPNSQAVSSS